MNPPIVDYWLPELSDFDDSVPNYQVSAPLPGLPDGIQIPYITGQMEPKQEEREHADWVSFYRYQVDEEMYHDKWYDSNYLMVKGSIEHSSTVVPCRCGEKGTYRTWPDWMNKLNNMSYRINKHCRHYGLKFRDLRGYFQFTHGCRNGVC